MRLRNLFFVCADLRRSHAFYVDLGLTLLKEGKRSVVLSLGDLELHLHSKLTKDEEARYGVRPGPTTSTVICLQTTELDRHASRLDKTPRLAPWGQRMFMVEDPDGRLLEISE